MRRVHISGVTPFYVRTFSECFFTADNPCTRSEPLHRPGVVRTDERLARYFRDSEVLRRSQYFNDWMRPQKLAHTLGATLLSDGRTIANLSLLRSAEAGSFRADEVASFAGLCGHPRRAVQIAMRVQTLTARGLTTSEALDHLPYGVAFLDRRGRLLHGNLAADALLRRGEGPDGRHLFWVADELKGPGQGALTAVYVDGVAAVRADGYFFRAVPGSFTMDENGAVTFFAADGAVVKRYRITASPDMDVDRTIAAAVATRARAVDSEKATKKRAEEEATAAKAKAAGDAAAARAAQEKRAADALKARQEALEARAKARKLQLLNVQRARRGLPPLTRLPEP